MRRTTAKSQFNENDEIHYQFMLIKEWVKLKYACFPFSLSIETHCEMISSIYHDIPPIITFLHIQISHNASNTTEYHEIHLTLANECKRKYMPNRISFFFQNLRCSVFNIIHTMTFFIAFMYSTK